MKWQISTPARLELLGPSMAGKSTLLLKLVGDNSVWDQPMKKVIYAAPMLEDREDYLVSLDRVCQDSGKTLMTFEGIPTLAAMRDFALDDRLLLILDDVLGFEDPSLLKDLATMHSHHFGISMVFCSQQPFYRSSKLDLLTLSRNLTGRFLLYQLVDWNAYHMLNRRLFPERKNFLLDCLSEAKTRHHLPYIFINVHCHSGLPRRHVCYTALFRDERAAHEDSPIFFDLQQQKKRV